MDYAVANKRRKFRISSENPAKQALIREIMSRHKGKQILLIGMYIDQLKEAAKGLDIPLITGYTSQKKRDSLYEDFKDGKIGVPAISKVRNVAIQISGTFGSRQEKAQRLGRILRPKPGETQVYLYSRVTRDTVEQDFALKRQLFLCEQGYEYVRRSESSF